MIGDRAGAQPCLVQPRATVLRKVCVVTHSYSPTRPSVSRKLRCTLLGLRTVPRAVGKRVSMSPRVVHAHNRARVARCCGSDGSPPSAAISRTYVTDRDLGLWQRAERYAAKHRMKISAVVLAALQRFLDEAGDEDERLDR